ncbi:nucleotidyltransferase family protein [Microbacterium terricola]|uniref:Nucleotidyltransferase family protein n=1 Tax=Microbacterium terricola TaxID=344163 RepID=A0ABM8DVX7_9MICO|nr:nucleotidyltransferase family protein [Microbacterium terricola]UYK39502.1 nucleotidyltransferase family protein [Microbacterium terricola]BDV29765.1 hypothetical protein Microterr_04250 [Microbacterium terricola]
MSAPPSTLRLDEADALASAWVQHVADAHGIRTLLIKGAALAHYGLREPRTSADVDVLVEPARFEEFCEAISAAAWTERPGGLIGELTTLHSRTFLREGWPCDLDVHSFFPGFLNDPADVFDALWATRRRLDFAHRPCSIPSKAGCALILALHSVRSTTTQVRHADELERLLLTPFTDEDRAAIARLAHDTGCVTSLASVLPRLHIDVTPGPAELQSVRRREWDDKLAAAASPANAWVVALGRVPWRRKPLVAWRAIWPTSEDLLIAHPEVPDRFFPKLLARILRWGRGLRSLPRAAGAIWHNRSH